MDCRFCLQSIRDTAKCLVCGHIFCNNCISSVIDTPRGHRKNVISCPECWTTSKTSGSNIRTIFIETSTQSGPRADNRASGTENTGDLENNSAGTRHLAQTLNRAPLGANQPIGDALPFANDDMDSDDSDSDEEAYHPQLLVSTRASQQGRTDAHARPMVAYAPSGLSRRYMRNPPPARNPLGRAMDATHANNSLSEREWERVALHENEDAYAANMTALQDPMRVSTAGRRIPGDWDVSPPPSPASSASSETPATKIARRFAASSADRSSRQNARARTSASQFASTSTRSDAHRANFSREFEVELADIRAHIQELEAMFQREIARFGY